MTAQPSVGPWPLFQFLDRIHSLQASLDGGSTRRKAATYTQSNTTQNKCTQTSMPRVRFETTIPVFERAKTVHALDRAATVISLAPTHLYVVFMTSLSDNRHWYLLIWCWQSFKRITVLLYYPVIYGICRVLISNLWHPSNQYASHFESQCITSEFKKQKTFPFHYPALWIYVSKCVNICAGFILPALWLQFKVKKDECIYAAEIYNEWPCFKYTLQHRNSRFIASYCLEGYMQTSG
jgi:hypothetical protein